MGGRPAPEQGGRHRRKCAPDCARFCLNYKKDVADEMIPNMTAVYLTGSLESDRLVNGALTMGTMRLSLCRTLPPRQSALRYPRPSSHRLRALILHGGQRAGTGSSHHGRKHLSRRRCTGDRVAHHKFACVETTRRWRGSSHSVLTASHAGALLHPALERILMFGRSKPAYIASAGFIYAA